MERSPTAALATEDVVDFVRRHCSVGTDHACGYAESTVTEDVALE